MKSWKRWFAGLSRLGRGDPGRDDPGRDESEPPLPAAPGPAAASADIGDEQVRALTEAQVRDLVWAGFDTPADVFEQVREAWDWDQPLDTDWLRALVDREARSKRDAEKRWPAQTDNDRLEAAFEALDARGVIALHNAGYTMQDGLSDVAEALHERAGAAHLAGYCFYHQQDVEAALEEDALFLAFGDMHGDADQSRAVAQSVVDVLQAHGFAVVWPGDVHARIKIEPFKWQRRQYGPRPRAASE